MTVSTQQIEVLQAFVRDKDRSGPPYLAGRHDLIDGLEEICEFIWSQFQRGEDRMPRGMTRVYTGPPGSGKSSMLKHLERKWNAAIQRGEFAPRMLYLPTAEDFENLEQWERPLVEALDPRMGKKLDRMAKSWRRRDPGLLSFKVGGQPSDLAKPDPIYNVLRLCPPDKWKRPLVLAIDEFQSCTGDYTSNNGAIIQSLHAHGYYAPLLAVVAGIGDIGNRLATLGISRLASRSSFSLGRFTPADTADLVSGWGQLFELPEGSWQGDMQELIAECGHWPAHAHDALAAFADQVTKCRDVNLVDFTAVRARSHELQLQGHLNRMSDEMKESRRLLAAALSEIGPRTRSGEVAYRLEKLAGTGNAPGWELPKGMNDYEFYRHLVNQGAVQSLIPSGVCCPIPGFRKFIVDFAER